jgi:hypothetical protein
MVLFSFRNQGIMLMETIEIPRFLLDYFDSTTIRTPLSSIRGYADVMLEGEVGPLTDEQRKFLEIIRKNAEQLDQHFNLVIHNRHYIIWDEQAIPVQYTAYKFFREFRGVLNHYPGMLLTAQGLDEALPVWFDKRHIPNMSASIGDFISNTSDEGKEIQFKSFHQTQAAAFSIEYSKSRNVRKRDLAYFESFLYVAKRVMELHNGLFSVTHGADEKIALTLVFPDIASLNPDL